jgi:hypothetical protein
MTNTNKIRYININIINGKNYIHIRKNGRIYGKKVPFSDFKSNKDNHYAKYIIGTIYYYGKC